MQAQRETMPAGAHGALVAIRWLLVGALAVGVILHTWLAFVELSEVDQATSFYLANVALGLAPAVAYGVAIVLAFSPLSGAGDAGRVAWSILLGCGLAFSAVSLFYLLSVGFGELMFAPFCLVALALLQLLSFRRRVAQVE